MISFFDWCVYHLDYYCDSGEFNARNRNDAMQKIQRNAGRLTAGQFDSAIMFVYSNCNYLYAQRHDNDGLIDII